MFRLGLLLGLVLLGGLALRTVNAVEPLPEIEVFTRRGCPRCAAAERFLDELRRERPTLRVAVRDLEDDPSAAQRLRRLAAARGIAVLGVPVFAIGNDLLVGFRSADTTGAQIRQLIELGAPGVPSGAAPACPPGSPLPCGTESGATVGTGAVSVPFVGRIGVEEIGLPAFTVVVGLLDGFNPCAMWVLLFLLSLLVNLRSRPKMLLIGGTFVVASGAVYFAFMAAWLNVLLLVGLARPTQVVLGLVALAVGTINVKDFISFGHGVSLAIPDAAKPGIYARVRAILQAEQLTGALAGVIVLALMVNTIELLCTAGLPAVYTQILTLRELPWWQYYVYLTLYNMAYMLDDSVMLAIAVATLGRYKLQERGGRWLKLVSGLVMLGLGAALILRPDWLVSP